MATPDEEILVTLDRLSRRTRGKRMTKLLDEELQEDELFWNQEALKEEEGDANYEEEGEAVDVFDSDFDEDEPEAEGDVENDGEDRERKKKRLIYPGKPAAKKKKKKVLSKLGKSSQDGISSPTREATPPEHHDGPDDLEAEKTVRKSTRTSVIVRQAEREAIQAAMQATMKPVKRKKEGEEKKMTQEEMLLEAAETEIMNLRNLERVLAREEEVKKRAVVQKMVYSGPQVRYYSKDGKNTLEFSKGLSFQSEICTTRPPYPQKAICVITGLPAKYRDPKTGLPYATKEAFKVIRERLSLDNNRVNKEKNDMGFLLDSISGQGFLAKRKRSEIVNRHETSHLRYWARFRNIPALENHTAD